MTDAVATGKHAPSALPSPLPVLSGQQWAGACDCHIHINDPRYPYVAEADLHPPAATVADYRQLQARLGTRRVVVVQPSSYGTDNRCTLDAVAELGLDAARAVVVVDASTNADDMAAMHQRGARGVRFNLLRPSPVAAAHMQAVARLIAPWGWHLQLHASADQIAALAPVIRDLPVPVVFDHLARLPGHGGSAHPAFDLVAELLQQQRAWLKLSGAELDGAAEAPGYASAAGVAQRFIALAPNRLVWGSNWPHPAIHKTGDAAPDDAALLRWLSACAPDSAVQRQILLDNACNLYGFSV